MKNLLKYRESDYFNSEDLFLLHTNLERYYVTKVKHWNGAWFSEEGLKLKMTSIKAINCKELHHKKIMYLDTGLSGVITKFMEPNQFGVNWDQGLNIKKYGMPSYWNSPSKLNMCR